MLLGLAKYRGVKRFILTVPIMTPKLSSLWLTLFTSVPYSLARSLVGSLGNEVIVQKTGIEKVVNRRCLSYQRSPRICLSKDTGNNVLSSWSDGADEKAPSVNDAYIPSQGCFKDVREAKIAGDVKAAVDRIFGLGGDNGWYYGEWLWELRGIMDKMVGGVGIRRGRRCPDDLESGDVLDFWRVLIADREEGRLYYLQK